MTVRADPDRIAQALGNLLANALRHTPQGGHVDVAVSRDGPDATVTVSDTGEGIAAEHLPHPFDRFYRGNAARSQDGGGSGIGLTITRAIVRAYGGSIQADSGGPGAGARFTIRLPAASW